jgi:hypothetical protein
MKRNYVSFSKIVIVNVIVMLHVLSPASAGVGLYGKHQSSALPAQESDSKQSLLPSSSDGSIGLFDNSSHPVLMAPPGGVDAGHGSHVPVADGLASMLLMTGAYLLNRRFFSSKKKTSH